MSISGLGHKSGGATGDYQIPPIGFSYNLEAEETGPLFPCSCLLLDQKHSTVKHNVQPVLLQDMLTLT